MVRPVRWRAAALALLLGLLAATAVEAQRPQVRRGFWFSAGGGAGHTTSDCDQCDVENRELGNYLSLTVGGTVRRNVLVAAEANSWSRAFDGGEDSLLGVFTVVQWYPWDALGWHLRTGVGWSLARSGFQVGETQGSADKVGLGLRFGSGWDIRVSPRVSVSPFLGIHIAALGEKEVRGVTLTNLLTASRQVGVGVTVH